MHAPHTIPGATLPFEFLLEQLKRHGFRVGVEHHLRVRQLLNRCADCCSPADLKTLLCPVFATNAEQQELFYRAFETAYPFLRDDLVDRPDGMGVVNAGTAASVPQLTVRRWPYVAAALIVAILSVTYLTKKLTERRNRPVQQAASAATSAPQAGKQPAQSPPPLPAAEPTPPPPNDRRVGFQVNRLPPSESRSLAWYGEHRIAIGFSAVLGPLFLWLFWELYRFRKRRMFIRKARGKVPPYSWPVRADVTPEIYDPQDLAVVSRLLHRRYQWESARLDVAGTVEASIEALGFPTFRYRRDSRLPEYLFLIDRASFRDHQSLLHEHLATMLRGQGLYVSTYFYEGDPRVCWSSSGDESWYLEDLQRTCAGYRLLLFGNGEQLLDAVTGRLVHWRRTFEGWTDRAVLTPLPASQWGSRELTLAAQFAVAPATLEGLTALAAYFELPTSLSQHAWTDHGSAQESGASVVDSLRRYLGPDVFQWLCACAIYPEVQWDLTLSLGGLPSMPAGLVCEENLVKLLRLEWFRSGSVPDELRRELISQLDSKVEREVRESIVRILETSPAPAETFAASAHQFQIAYQRSWLAPKDRKARRELQAALENLAPDEIEQDYAYLDAADSVAQSPLQLLLPRRLRKIVYPAGASWMGPRAMVRLVAMVVVAVGALLGLRGIDTRHSRELARYRGDLAKGVGLSVTESGDRVQIDWRTSLPALRHARSGVLTIKENGSTVQVSLGRDALDAGHAEFRAVSANPQFELAVLDDMQNQSAEAIGIQRSLPPARGTPPASAQSAGSIQIAGRTLQHLPALTIAQQRMTIINAALTTAGSSVAPPPDSSTFDRLLAATGVAPPTQKGQAVLGRKVWGHPWEYRLAIQDSATQRLVADNVLVEGARLNLILARDQNVRSALDRWIYVYVIDANGAVQLAFPRVGDLGNQIRFGQSVEVPLKPAADLIVTAPFGTDRYVMFATLKPIDDPAAVGSIQSRRGTTNPLQPILDALRQGTDPTVPGGTTLEVLTVLSVPKSQQPAPAVGNTYALLIGVSRYKKPELNLQYAAADANLMADFLRSPRGGGVPSENILLLTDEKATTFALRLGLRDLLLRRAGKNDTVIILIEGHGTVEAPGSKSGFIVTHDSDPQDLRSTAFGIDELQFVFTTVLQNVARVVMFVDLSKAGAVSQMSTANMASSVEALGALPGKLFGFLASKPNEVSLEGPQSVGGHGVFTYFLVKGMEGEADENSDGFVDAGELVTYVTAQVRKATARKQTPREFGTFESEMRLSDLSKPGPR